MTKQLIAIDIDDVIADSTESIRQLVNSRFGVDLTEAHYSVRGQYSGYYTRIWQEHGLSDRFSYSDLEDEMVIDQSHVPILEGAREAIYKLSTDYHIVLITSRDPNWEKATRRWFKEHFGIDDLNIYFTGNYHTGVKKDKGELCRELGVSLLIDDNPDHCLSALKHGVRAILFGDYGWHVDVPQDLVRCRNWSMVLEYLKHA
ncbi:MAG: uncharacterized protein JWO07_487 [Candidatus Saccharibacteria bacterium]|nr:uncharacterized protein [Candidatus Saccharibacteria bacterium]